MAKSKKRRRILVFSIIVVALGGLTAVVILKKRDIVTTVQTEKVTRRDLTELVMANGRIQPVLQVKISAEVSGEIIALPVKEGQSVNKGDLLVKIKPDLYIAAVNQAKALYESAQAGKAQSVANLEKAEADYVRNKNLFEQKLLSESDFIGFKAADEIAKAQLESSLHQVENAKAQVASAQDSLDKTIITSPMTATVSKLSLQLGERVAALAGADFSSPITSVAGCEPAAGEPQEAEPATARGERGPHKSRAAPAAPAPRPRKPARSKRRRDAERLGEPELARRAQGRGRRFVPRDRRGR